MLPAASSAMAEGVSRPLRTWGVPPPAGRIRRLAEPGAAPDCRIYALPGESMVMATALASEPWIVLTVPGVKTLIGPIPLALSPRASELPETESVSVSGALRTPGFVGLKLTKTWQGRGGIPGAAAERLPTQVLLVIL